MTHPIYSLYGLRIRSAVPLEVPAGAGAPEVDIARIGEAPIPDGPPSGRLLAEVRVEDLACFVARDGASLTIRVPGACEFRVEMAEPIRVGIVEDPQADPALLPLLVEGTLMSQVLTSRGELTLHGSAVEFPGGAIGLLGGSGAGKSTLAAVLAAAGGRPVTDDLIRVIPEGGRFRCAVGTGRLRLRSQAASLAESFAADRVARDPDGRISVSLDPPTRPPRLAAILFPVPVHERKTTRVRRLTAAEAAVEIGRYPRSLGWSDVDVRRARFALIAQLARAVPAAEVRPSWGPPFADDLAADLLAASGLAPAVLDRNGTP